MHELERHNLILLSVQQKPVLTVMDICELTRASAATIRRDIATLHLEKKLTYGKSYYINYSMTPTREKHFEEICFVDK